MEIPMLKLRINAEFPDVNSAAEFIYWLNRAYDRVAHGSVLLTYPGVTGVAYCPPSLEAAIQRKAMEMGATMTEVDPIETAVGSC
jgi:hypothetical protein